MTINPLYLATVTDVLALWSELAGSDEEGELTGLAAGVFEPRGQALVVRVDGDACYVHGTSGFTPPEGWTVIEEHVNDERGWKALYDRVPGHARKLLRARVYRRTDGADLRAELLAEKKVPQTGHTSAKPKDPEAAKKALEAARARLDDDVEARTMTMDQVADGDLVEEDLLMPHYWM